MDVVGLGKHGGKRQIMVSTCTNHELWSDGIDVECSLSRSTNLEGDYLLHELCSDGIDVDWVKVLTLQEL